jgi:hypothetical protein
MDITARTPEEIEEMRETLQERLRTHPVALRDIAFGEGMNTVVAYNAAINALDFALGKRDELLGEVR